MLIKEAIEYICNTKGMFIVKRFIRNHKKLTENHLSGQLEQKYFCKGHNKCHKYTFHSRIEFCPGTALFSGWETAKEVIKYAEELKLKIDAKKVEKISN